MARRGSELFAISEQPGRAVPRGGVPRPAGYARCRRLAEEIARSASRFMVRSMMTWRLS